MYNVESIWRSMKARCYSSNLPSYADCTVCKEWILDYKAFSNWFIENLYDCGGEKLELDKDLFSNGKKIYSPDTCCLLPRRINRALAYKKSSYSIFPTGITINSSGNYRASVCSGHSHLGKTFHTLDEAVEFYCKAKERNIKRLATAYENYIPDNIYNALMEYKCAVFYKR